MVDTSKNSDRWIYIEVSNYGYKRMLFALCSKREVYTNRVKWVTNGPITILAIHFSVYNYFFLKNLTYELLTAYYIPFKPLYVVYRGEKYTFLFFNELITERHRNRELIMKDLIIKIKERSPLRFFLILMLLNRELYTSDAIVRVKRAEKRLTVKFFLISVLILLHKIS